MAYCDYGAFVYKNDKRMRNYEDADYNGRVVHGLMRDGKMEVICYKQGLPTILYDGNEIDYYDHSEIDYFDFEPFGFEVLGYSFYFSKFDHYAVEMTCPNGDVWECVYDYGYGAGLVFTMMEDQT